MQYYSADLIFTNNGAPLRDHIIVVDKEGEIIDLLEKDKVTADVKEFDGAIVPGFVNAHCHLGAISL